MSSVANSSRLLRRYDVTSYRTRQIRYQSVAAAHPAFKPHRQRGERTSVHAPLHPQAETADLIQFADAPVQTEEDRCISKNELLGLENQLSNGDAMLALAEFNNVLRQLTAEDWEASLHGVFSEWCFNLESFNPAFAAVFLQVQLSIGESDYYRRDNCLKCLIQPLAGEYGMHHNEPQGKTHRQLFKDFYESVYPQSSLEALLCQEPVHAKILFDKMMHDIQSHGENSVERASYALGYNLAIEFLADYEKRWMLQSFQQLASNVMHRPLDWTFLEVHAEDEKEHAEIGHQAVLSFVPRSHLHLLEQAMHKHDKDFANFYNQLTELLIQ